MSRNSTTITLGKRSLTDLVVPLDSEDVLLPVLVGGGPPGAAEDAHQGEDAQHGAQRRQGQQGGPRHWNEEESD